MNSSPWAAYLETVRVLALHREAIRRYGGDGTQRQQDIDCVSGCLGNALSATLYREPTDAHQGLAFAGFLVYYLIKNHCFVDGNKRVAWLAGMQVLLSIGLTIAATDNEGEAMANDVATDKLTSGEAVVVWLAERLKAIN